MFFFKKNFEQNRPSVYLLFLAFPGTMHEAADYNLLSKFFTWGIQP